MEITEGKRVAKGNAWVQGADIKPLLQKKASDINKTKGKMPGTSLSLPLSVSLSALQYETQRLLLLHCSGLLCVGVKLECPW